MFALGWNLDSKTCSTTIGSWTVFENIQRISKQLPNDTLSLHYLWSGVQDNLGWILQFSFGTCQTSNISLGNEWALNITQVYSTNKEKATIHKWGLILYSYTCTETTMSLISHFCSSFRSHSGTRLHSLWGVLRFTFVKSWEMLLIPITFSYSRNSSCFSLL